MIEKDSYKTVIGSGPLSQPPTSSHRGSSKAVRGGKKKRSKKKKAVCFNTWISLLTCLLTMEASAMIFLLFHSHTILITTSTAPEDALDFFVWLDTTLGGGGEKDREELAELEAHLVQLTEDRLDHGYALDTEVETSAIDNYYNRSAAQHFPTTGDDLQPAVLLVAGMKGSGARAVVDALIQLHIPMITLDRADTQKEADRKAFHIGQMAWRNMINLVMSSGIRTPNYEFSQLPHFTQLSIRQEWEKFYQGFIAKHIPETAMTSSSSNHHNHNNRQLPPVLFGFQAHDSLFMIPVVQHFLQLQQQPLKVLQVVRDGRDVSMISSKTEVGTDKKQHPMQSMAERFVLETYYDVSNISKSYDDTASLSREMQRLVESMELWADWNSEAHTWLQRNYQTRQSSSTNSAVLEYLQLRTEDLLSPEKKLEALLELVNFTSTKTIPFHQLCCMSRQAMVIEKPNSAYLQGFAKARAQHQLIQKYSAQLSFYHTEQDEDEQRKARLGDVFVGQSLGRHHHQRGQATPQDAQQHQVHQRRQERFQDIGDRLAARVSNPTEGGGRRRLLMEDRAKRREWHKEEDPQQHQSPEVARLFEDYFAWRKSLGKAKKDKDAASIAIETGEKLLAQYRTLQEHLKGVLTEDSFIRSIKWLKELHNSDNKNNHRDGSGEETTEIASLHSAQHYGKWVHVLKDQPLLSQRLHSVGKLTLEAFGYEPRTRFMDFDPQKQKAQCHMEVTCG